MTLMISNNTFEFGLRQSMYLLTATAAANSTLCGFKYSKNLFQSNLELSSFTLGLLCIILEGDWALQNAGPLYNRRAPSPKLTPTHNFHGLQIRNNSDLALFSDPHFTSEKCLFKAFEGLFFTKFVKSKLVFEVSHLKHFFILVYQTSFTLKMD